MQETDSESSLSSEKKLKFSKTLERMRPQLNDLFKNNTKIDSPVGVPPPEDEESLSLNSSISMQDLSAPDQLSLIRTKNRELKREATMTIKDFKNTSRYLMSRSQLQSDKNSVILNEFESDKRNQDDNEGDKSPSINKLLNINSLESEENIGLVYQKIQDIQKEISEAAQRLIESERMILSTEEKNMVLENRIKDLEKSLYGMEVIEGPEKCKTEHCLCKVF